MTSFFSLHEGYNGKTVVLVMSGFDRLNLTDSFYLVVKSFYSALNDLTGLLTAARQER